MLHLLLLMLNLCKTHHHSAEISFLTMLFPFRLSLWLSWVIPNHSPYLFVQLFLSSYQSCQKNKNFLHKSFVFYLMATYSSYLSTVASLVSAPFPVNNGMTCHPQQCMALPIFSYKMFDSTSAFYVIKCHSLWLYNKSFGLLIF